MQKAWTRIEDVCVWRKALAEKPDETLMILVEGLRMIAAGKRRARDIAALTLGAVGLEHGIKESK